MPGGQGQGPEPGCALEQVIAWVGLEDPQEKPQAEERWKSVLLCPAK